MKINVNKMDIINMTLYTTLCVAVKKGKTARLSEIVRMCLTGITDEQIGAILREDVHISGDGKLSAGPWPNNSELTATLEAWRRQWIAAPILDTDRPAWPQLLSDQGWRLIEWGEVIHGQPQANLPWIGATEAEEYESGHGKDLTPAESDQISALAPNLKETARIIFRQNFIPDARCERLILFWHGEETRYAAFVSAPLPALAPHQTLITSPEDWWTEANATCPPESADDTFNFGGDANA